MKKQSCASIPYEIKKGARRKVSRINPIGVEPCCAWIYRSDHPIIEAEAHVDITDPDKPVLILPDKKLYENLNGCFCAAAMSSARLLPMWLSLSVIAPATSDEGVFKYPCHAKEPIILDQIVRQVNSYANLTPKSKTRNT